MTALHSAIASLLVCGSMAAVAADHPGLPAESAYHDGQPVRMAFAPAAKGSPAVRVGPWLLGARVNDFKPREKRLNLYVASPGAQHHAEGFEEFDHNLIINAVPTGENFAEWDVYWAVVLDPSFSTDLRGEHDLLQAAQQSFTPGDLLEFEDVPGRTFLKEFLKVDSLAGLVKYRRRDGSLPCLLILPSGSAVRAAVTALASEPK